MSSIKSLATLVILAVVGCFLYMKITATEPVLPPEAAGLDIGVPQIEIGSGDDVGFSAPPEGVAANGFNSQTAGTTAPAFDASAGATSAPAWSTETAPATNAAVGPSGVNALPAIAPVIQAPTIPEPVTLPPPVTSSVPPANPFDSANSSAQQSGNLTASTSNGNVLPGNTVLPPPGVMAAPQQVTVIEGRVYDDAEPSTVGLAQQPAIPPVVEPGYVTPVVEQPVTPYTSNTTPQVTLQTVQSHLSRNEYAEALRLLTTLSKSPSMPPEQTEAVQQLLGQLAGTVIYSQQHLLEPAHSVLPGETMDSIAMQYQVPAALLAKINGVEAASTLTPGTELKVIRGPFTAEVDLAKQQLVLLLDGRYAGQFPIELGTDQSNMTGRWIVTAKDTNPAYLGSGGVPVAGGDAANPLGDRMLVLEQPTGNSGMFGIHGGSAADGRGYVRLADSSVKDVYDILSVGSLVTVRR